MLSKDLWSSSNRIYRLVGLLLFRSYNASIKAMTDQQCSLQFNKNHSNVIHFLQLLLIFNLSFCD